MCGGTNVSGGNSACQANESLGDLLGPVDLAEDVPRDVVDRRVGAMTSGCAGWGHPGSPCRGCLWGCRHGEAGLLGVAADDRLAVGVGQHRLDVVEAVGRQPLDRVDDALGTALAVGVDDLRGRAAGAPPRSGAAPRRRRRRSRRPARRRAASRRASPGWRRWSRPGTSGARRRRAASRARVTSGRSGRGRRPGTPRTPACRLDQRRHVDLVDAKRATWGSTSSRRPGRDQSSRRGGGVPSSPILRHHRPVGEAVFARRCRRRSGTGRPWPPCRRR